MARLSVRLRNISTSPYISIGRSSLVRIGVLVRIVHFFLLVPSAYKLRVSSIHATVAAATARTA